MNRMCVYGVVKGGQVVLDAPLPLADGTRVAVVNPTPAPPAGNGDSPVGSDKPYQTEDERRAAVEQLILEGVRLRGSPAEIADVERLIRESRGANG